VTLLTVGTAWAEVDTGARGALGTALPTPPDAEATTGQSSMVAAPPTTEDERVPATHRKPPSSTAPSAHQPASEERRERTESARRWYGWQTLATDAAAIAMASSVPLTHENTSRTYEGAVIVMTATTYLLGGPVVHVAHDKVGTGAGSLGLRVGCPLLLGAAGYALGGGPGSGGDNGWIGGVMGGIVGGTLGVVVAMTIDASVLAYDHGPQPPTASPPRPQAAFAPTASGGPGWFEIGAAGSF
jgi:hypothetical protein